MSRQRSSFRRYAEALFVVVSVTSGGGRLSSGLEMVLTHVGDVHARFDETDGRGHQCFGGRCYGGMARVAGAVAAQRKEAADSGIPFLFLVAGDNFQGTAYYTLFKWKPVAEFVNRLAPNVSTLGNHEFDDGPGGLLPYLRATADRAPVVAANVVMDSEEAARFVKPSWTTTLTDRAGRTATVAVVGYVTTKSEFTSNPGRINFTDEMVSLREEISRLKTKGVDIVIGLGHSGIDMDKIIAAQVDGIDMIVGGHSHTFLYTGDPPDVDEPRGPYPTWVTTATGKRVPIVHAYAFTKYLGRVYVRFGENGEVEEIEGKPILLDSSITRDPEVSKLVDKWKSRLADKTSSFVGEITADLANDCRTVECDIGDMVTDSFVYYNVMTRTGRSNGDQSKAGWTDAPIAVLQAGSVRAPIEFSHHRGKFSLAQLMSTMPFTNTLVKVTVTGKNLLDAFEHSAQTYNETIGSKFFLQVSGATVEYDMTRKPGNRVVSLSLRCGRCAIPEFEPVDPDAHYTVLMSDYLAGGGDRYAAFHTEVIDFKSLGVGTHAVIMAYTNATGPVRTIPKGTRIRFLATAGDDRVSDIAGGKGGERRRKRQRLQRTSNQT